MKRDLNLVKRLLLLIEEMESESDELKIPSDIDHDVAVYHLKIMEQAGFIENNIKYADNEPIWIYSSLTWDGHEFLDAIRNDKVWTKVKNVAAEKGGTIPFEVLKSLAIDLTKKFFMGDS